MPELPDIAAYISALEPRIVGQPVEHVRTGQSFSASHRAAPGSRCGRKDGSRAAAHRQAHRDWCGRRSLAGAAPDDCRPPALEASSGQACRTQESGSLRFSHWLSRAYRSRHQAPRIVVGRRRRGGACKPWTREESMSSPAISTHFATLLRSKIARSSELLPIRALSAASATRIRMKFCTQPSCRRSR